ncbi:MAG: hypothetical protein EOP31_26365 [Rhodococcus sp. (in: high G+C Gram-positive bacteria)]|uniref:hypothetical protein n=1 Tax=Rhodococcus sp. TaxID=1831 RepID=UPI0011FF82D5|nr:hypothetical protein [Rhodococcus sp. (in: high G+C Gram-positive bacteria)]RZL21812.1 MAG: hypothetical protein EOP31_26365 [Rhodococcus sp. (in: high G+C Gram-positive bacteria)]
MTGPSPVAQLDALARGIVEAPASDCHPAADRWTWFADLYADQTWGLVTAVPEFPRIAADQAAMACRATAMQSATAEQWSALETLSAAGLATANTHSLKMAWTALTDTCIDARDHLAGNDFGGLEAILCVIEAVLCRHQESITAIFISDAYAAWDRQIESHDRKAA